MWVPDESLIDAVTAVSGSGPAYVFLLAETLAQAGVAAGLDMATAQQLARATVAGAGELLRQSQSDAATLRQNVTSPGGTTAAALAVLMREGDGLKELMTEAVIAAEKRGVASSGVDRGWVSVSAAARDLLRFVPHGLATHGVRNSGPGLRAWRTPCRSRMG